MRTAALSAILLAIPLAAGAQSQDCQSITKNVDRLSCYDRASPPIRPEKGRASRAASSSKNNVDAGSATASQTPLADMLDVENKKLDTRIKSICRGC